MILSARPAVLADAETFEARPADARECENYGLTVCEAIKMSINGSVLAHVVEVDDEVAAIWGYGAPSFAGGGTALGWLLTTKVVDRHPKLFVKSSKKIVEYILERYPRLLVLVDKEHTKALAWLRHLGFRPGGEGDKPGFVYMEKVR